MTETKCPQCGKIFATGMNHVCNPEDVEEQKKRLTEDGKSKKMYSWY